MSPPGSLKAVLLRATRAWSAGRPHTDNPYDLADLVADLGLDRSLRAICSRRAIALQRGILSGVGDT